MDSGVAVMGADLPEVQKILRIAQSEESCFELGAGAGSLHRFRPGVPKFASANRRARLAPLINRFDDALLKTAKMVVAEASDRKRWKKIGVRELMRKSKLSQKAVYSIMNGQPVRRSTL